MNAPEMRRLYRTLLLSLVAALGPRPACAQDLGHRLIGTLGSHAGEQRGAGLYVADRFVFYGASTVRDRTGAPLDSDGEGPRISAFGNAFGLGATLSIEPIATYVSIAAAVPVAHVSLRSDRPEVSVDRFGLGDVFVQPLGLGWRLPHVDLVVTYGLYIPTGLFRLGEGGLSSGHLTHQLGLGTALFLDTERRFRLSARVSYDLNHTKNGVDITRGDTLQLQGGVGALLFDLIDLGAVGAAIWQVRDDRGADLPPALTGVRERAFGVGAELGVVVAAIGGRVGVRYLHELGARARPEGHVLLFEVAILAWQPDAPAPPNPEHPANPPSRPSTPASPGPG